MIATTLLTLCLLSPLGGQEATNTGPLREYAAPATINALAYETSSVGRIMATAFRPTTRIVPHERIDKEVTAHCSKWMRRFVREECIPQNLDSLWYGQPQAPKDKDLVIAPYSIQGYDVAWIDKEDTVALVVHSPNDAPLDTKEEAAQVIKEVLLRFLNVPASEAAKPFHISITPHQAGTRRLWMGLCRFSNAENPRSRSISNTSQWYDDFHCWTDGATTYLRMNPWGFDEIKWPFVGGSTPDSIPKPKPRLPRD